MFNPGVLPESLYAISDQPITQRETPYSCPKPCLDLCRGTHETNRIPYF